MMIAVMLSGGINLSIIATTNMTALITACILTRFISESTAIGSALVMITAIAAGLVMALLVGTVNGLIIAYITAYLRF